jgi:hypothetical protein
MTDPAPLEPANRALEDFVRALRAFEVRVSPAEAIDAHRAAMEVGFADRALLRDALAVTLAKSAEEVERFEVCFDTFFAREEFTGPGGGEASAAEADLADMLLSGDQAALAQAMEAAAGRARAGDIQISTQRGLLARRVLDEMGLRALEMSIQSLRDSEASDDQAVAERLAQARVALFAEARRFVDRQADLYAGETGRRLRDQILSRQALTRVEQEDIRAMEALVRRMARRLAQRYARRRHRAKLGKLDVRHTVRKSLS